MIKGWVHLHWSFISNLDIYEKQRKKCARVGPLAQWLWEETVLFKKMHPNQEIFCRHHWHADTINKVDISGEQQSWYFAHFSMQNTF